MNNYNKFMNQYDSDENTQEYDTNDSIVYRNDRYNSSDNNNNTILNTILQHPYIEELSIDLDECKHNINIVLYRISHYGENITTEFYLPKEFLSIQRTSDYELTYTLNETLCQITGMKRVNGTMLFENESYIFVQVRNNNDSRYWISIWDIIVNEHSFGEKINNKIIRFFKSNYDISTLIINKKYCLKPIVLYSNIDEQCLGYVEKNKSIQYCQREKDSLIRLHLYKEGDNVRHICFIEDDEYSTIYSSLSKKEYVKMIDDTTDRDQPLWIFKNDNNIISYIK